MSRWMVSCPLCRRDVHFLLPLHANYDPENPQSPIPPSSLPLSPHPATPGVFLSASTEFATLTTASREQFNPLPTTDTQPKTFISILRNRLVIETEFMGPIHV